MKKRLFIITFITTFILILSSCDRNITLEFKGREYTLTEHDVENHIKTYTSGNNKKITIQHSRDSCIINYNGDKYIVTGSENNVEVVFPNGEKGWMSYYENGAGGGGFMSFESNYLNIDDLRDLVFMKSKLNFNGKQFMLSIILGAVSLISVLIPKKSWYLSRGWQYQNTEPSDTYLGLTRFGGVIGCIISIIGIATSFTLN